MHFHGYNLNLQAGHDHLITRLHNCWLTFLITVSVNQVGLRQPVRTTFPLRKISRDELQERDDIIYIGKENQTYKVEVYAEREHEQEGRLVINDHRFRSKVIGMSSEQRRRLPLG